MLMSKLKRWKCALAVVCFAPLLSNAAPQTGWWWNPAESGRGYFIEVLEENVLFFGSYLYEDDGRATWLVSGGPMSDESSYSGRLSRLSGGQTLTGEYRAPTGIDDAGPVSLQFTYDDVGTLTTAGGTIPIERFHFGSPAAGFQPYEGWWWSEAESDSGYSIAVEGDQLFMVAYMYDEQGQPVWYITAGKMTSPTLYQGPLQQYANGQTLTGAYRPPSVPPVEVGNVTIDFSAEDAATLTITQNIPDAKGVRSRDFFVRPLRKKDPLDSLPRGWQGTFTVEATSHVENSGGTADEKNVWQGTIEWGLPDEDNPAPLPMHHGRVYVPVRMSLTSTADINSKSADGGYCTAKGTGTTSAFLDGNLELDGRGRYDGGLTTFLSYEVMQTCVTSDGKVNGPNPVPFTGIFALYFSGKQAYGMHGRPGPVVANFGIASARLKRSWDFTAVR